MTVRRTVLVLALLLAPAIASAQPAPPWARGGIVFGGGVTMRPKYDGGFKAYLGLEAWAGWLVAPRVALLGWASVVQNPYEDVRRSGGFAARAWVPRAPWLYGEARAGLTALQFYCFDDLSGPCTGEVVLGANVAAAAGIELTHRPSFAVELRAELAYERFGESARLSTGAVATVALAITGHVGRR